jgi:hypothetical protein
LRRSKRRRISLKELENDSFSISIAKTSAEISIQGQPLQSYPNCKVFANC